MKKIVASGCVVVQNGKFLLSHDGKDDFFKIPGGKPLEGESLEDCALRELNEETGYVGKIIGKLSTKYLKKKPGTDEKIDIELHHFKAEVLGRVESYESFWNEGHDVCWLDVGEIEKGKYDLAPNINFLIDKSEL
jgi:8-oxo-dGTP diphosphatase